MFTNNEFKVIAELDLDPIKVKLMHKESGEGWSLEYANAVEAEYRRFLYLMKMFPNEQTAPLFDVDTFWHYHILDTMKYAVDCDKVFGYFLHHFPYIGLRGEDDEAAHQRVGERMKELYEQTFGEPYLRDAQGGAGDTAWSGATATTAWSGATATTAWSGATAKTAWSGATARTAWSGATARTAWSGATARTAWSGATTGKAASPSAGQTAWSGATAKTAWSGATARTAWSGATARAGRAEGRPDARVAWSRANAAAGAQRFYSERPALPVAA